MTLAHLHYLVTGFCLTVWSRAPTTILAVMWAFQAILFIAGIATPDLDDYVFWQFITSLVGVLVGLTFYLVTNSPRMLRFVAAYVSIWGKFFIWLVFFVAAQLFYAFFRPPTLPWGLIGTSVSHVIIMAFLWFSSKYSTVLFRGYRGVRYMFMTWIVVLFGMELLFFLTYTGLAERWVAYIAAGAAILGLIVLRLVYPLRPAYTVGTADDSTESLLPGQ